MIIDIHSHTFPERIAPGTIEHLSREAHIVPFSDGTDASLLLSMEKAGIGLSVVLPVATAPRQVEKVNRANAALIEERQKSGLLFFACMHPDLENWKGALSEIVSMGFKGIKIHPVYQGVDIDDIRYMRILFRAAELGLIVISHTGYDIGFPGLDHCSPKMCRHLVDELGDFPFILAHMGGWRSWEQVPFYLADTKVFLDTAFSFGKISPLNDHYWDKKELGMLDEEGMMSLIRAFGPERILFGTDSPWADQSESLSAFKSLPLDESEQRMILGENAAALLGLQQ